MGKVYFKIFIKGDYCHDHSQHNSVTGTKAEINQMIAAIEKPIMYFFTNGLAESEDLKF
jgi:hypothetical protein